MIIPTGIPAGGIQHTAFRLPFSGFEPVTNDLREHGYVVISKVDHPIGQKVREEKKDEYSKLK